MAISIRADQIGIVTDWDMARIYFANPELNPFTQTLKTEGGQAQDTLFRWLAQAVPTVSSASPLEEAPTTNFNRQERKELQGRIHRFKDAYGVTRTAGAVVVAGGVDRNELGQQRLWSLNRLKLMKEQAYLGYQDSAAEGATAGVGTTTRGALCWLDVTAQSELQVPAEVRPAAGNFYTGALSSLTPELLVSMILSMNSDVLTVQNFDLWAGINLRDKINKFTIVRPTTTASETAVVRYNEQGTSEYNVGVDVLNIQGSMVKVHTTYKLDLKPDGTARALLSGNARGLYSGLILNMDMWRDKVLRPLRHEDIAFDGSVDRAQYVLESGLKCGNPKGQGSIVPSAV